MAGLDWSRVLEVAREALDLAPEERSSFLDAACPGNGPLREAVNELLDADDRVPTVLEREGGLAAFLSSGPEEPPPPPTLGPYQVLEEIGRGGMGTVYRGRRADGRFDRLVAIKLLRGQFAQGPRNDSLRAEGRLLARLEHPGVARLYDAGFEAGQPYLVMELVPGEPIDRFADREGLSIRQRIQLFSQVCAAVQYAHQSLIVHRDLKPSNILVTEDGVTKLLDFGIAKLTDLQEGPEATHTRFRAMTPHYASPEQVRGEPVGAASDVYSLGVVLYELLTGVLPFDPGDDLWSGMKAVLESQPSRPSRAVLDISRTVEARIGPAELASRRSSSPQRMGKALKGDLDNIVLKAIEKDPADRFPSVQALLDDLRRFLEGRPVTARPAGRVYALRRFIARNRVTTFAALVATISVFGGLGAALWQARAAAAERDIARLEAARARRVSDFLVGIFETADPGQARVDTLSAREVLDAGAARVRGELAMEPELQATLMDVIGRVYANLGDREEADSLLTLALERRVELQGSDHPDVARSIAAIAGLAAGYDNELADSLFTRAVEIQRDALGGGHAEVGYALVGLGDAVRTSDSTRSRAVLEEARTIFEANPQGHEDGLASAIYGLAFLNHGMASYSRAEDLYLEALEVQRRFLGSAAPETIQTLSQLGWLLKVVGRLDESGEYFDEALTLRRRVYGDRHLTVANTLFGLAQLRLDQGDYSGAESAFRESGELYRDLSPNGVTPSQLAWLARALWPQGKFEEAESLYRQATASSAGGTEPTRARLLNDFGSFLEGRGDLAGAAMRYGEAHVLYERSFGEQHPFSALVLGNLASALHGQGKLDEAEPLYRASIETLEAAWGANHASVGVARMRYGTLLLRAGRGAEAGLLLTEAHDVISAALPSEHWRRGQAKLRLGAYLRSVGRAAEARELLLASRAILEDHRDVRPDDWATVNDELSELDSGATGS